MKRIYINGRFLSQKITGVQRYAEEITKSLDNLLNEKKEYEYIILVPKNVIRNLSLKNIKIKEVG
uniref:hypothetical protein n=1 Tax=Megamonas funiformis TaxID=437897 RepID=UPI003FF08306